MNNTCSYLIRPALHSEIDNGSLWISKELESKLIKITYDKKSIIVSNHFIDENYINHYNSNNTNRIILSESLIIMPDYYRKKLGLLKNKNYDISIQPVQGICYDLKYLQSHPNDIVRISYWLAVISISISIISLIFSIVTYF